VAVHVGSGVKPVTVNVTGFASLTDCAPAGEAVPLAQEKRTLTAVVSLLGLSEKSFFTVNVAVLSVL
jgi:hypothetical protein